MTTTSKDPIEARYAERLTLSPPMRFLQRIMTMLPDSDAESRHTGPVRHFARDVLLLAMFTIIAGAATMLMLVGGAAYLFFPMALYASLGTVGRLRKLTVGHKHEGGHGVGYDGLRAAGVHRHRLRQVRFSIMEICSILALGGPAIRYMREHGRHHQLSSLGTKRDPDGAKLLELGFRRGLAPGEFRRRLLGCLLNPLWYGADLKERMVQTLTMGPRASRVACAVGWGSIAISAVFLPGPVWFFAIGFPWLIGFPAASLLQVVTEHPYVDPVGATDLASYAAKTWERLPWQPTPGSAAAHPKGWLAWAAWWVKLLVVHVPSRLAVLDRTMIWHRYHHLAWLLGRPFDDWWNIDHEAARAWREGALPADWERNHLEGLGGALARQKRFMETDT